MPFLTIEEGLWEKFKTLAGNAELCGILKELRAAVATLPAMPECTRAYPAY